MKNLGLIVLFVVMGNSACSHKAAEPEASGPQAAPSVLKVPTESLPAASPAAASVPVSAPANAPVPKEAPASSGTCLQNGKPAEAPTDFESVWTSKDCFVRVGPAATTLSGENWSLQIAAGVFREETILSVFREPFRGSGARKPSEGVKAERSILVIEAKPDARFAAKKSLKVSLSVSKELAALINKEVGDPVAYYWRSEPAQEIAEWWDVKPSFHKSKNEISASVPVTGFFKHKKIQRMEILVGVEK